MNEERDEEKKERLPLASFDKNSVHFLEIRPLLHSMLIEPIFAHASFSNRYLSDSELLKGINRRDKEWWENVLYPEARF